MTIPAVGPVMALTWVLELGDIRRFRSIKQVISYCGLCSAEKSSAGMSLLLASVGLCGVLSYLTTQRTTELGIRMALGAEQDQLSQLMLVDGLRPALFGLGLGLAGSLAATRIFQSMLFGTKPLDPVVFFA